MFVLSGVVGAFLGASITLIFNMWKFHRDERSLRCDELCRAILEASQHASEYWATDFTKRPTAQQLSEARLFAVQTLIDGIFSDFRPFLPVDDELAVDALLSELVDLLTGGDYSVPGRRTDIERATRVLPAAGDIVVKIRRAYRDTTPFYRLSKAYHQNKRRRLDMPLGWDEG